MKYYSKVLSAVLCASMMFSIASCSASNSQTNSSFATTVNDNASIFYMMSERHEVNITNAIKFTLECQFIDSNDPIDVTLQIVDPHDEVVYEEVVPFTSGSPIEREVFPGDCGLQTYKVGTYTIRASSNYNSYVCETTTSVLRIIDELLAPERESSKLGEFSAGKYTNTYYKFALNLPDEFAVQTHGTYTSSNIRGYSVAFFSEDPKSSYQIYGLATTVSDVSEIELEDLVTYCTFIDEIEEASIVTINGEKYLMVVGEQVSIYFQSTGSDIFALVFTTTDRNDEIMNSALSTLKKIN